MKLLVYPNIQEDNMDNVFYEEYNKELLRQKAQLLSELNKQQSQSIGSLQSVLSGGGVYYGGGLKKGMQEITSEVMGKKAEGLGAIAMEQAKVNAIEKAQEKAKKIGKWKTIASVGGTALGALAGTIIAPGAGTITGAKLGASLGGLAGNIYGATQGDLSSMELIPQDIVGTIGMMSKDQLKEVQLKFMGKQLGLSPDEINEMSKPVTIFDNAYWGKSTTPSQTTSAPLSQTTSVPPPVAEEELDVYSNQMPTYRDWLNKKDWYIEQANSETNPALKARWQSIIDYYTNPQNFYFYK